jgi:hypothetical protein
MEGKLSDGCKGFEDGMDLNWLLFDAQRRFITHNALRKNLE